MSDRKYKIGLHQFEQWAARLEKSPCEVTTDVTVIAEVLSELVDALYDKECEEDE